MIKTAILILISTLCFSLTSHANDGTCKGDCLNGHGTYTWPDGQKYVGNWKEGNPHGYGVFTYKDGKTYSGFYLNGERHGFGIERVSGKIVRHGYWENDVFEPTIENQGFFEFLFCQELRMHPIKQYLL